MTRPEAILFDLFGTLVFFDPGKVPTVEFEGRRVPATVAGLSDLLADALPGVAVADFLAALAAAGADLAQRKEREGIELPTSARFAAALGALGAARKKIEPAAREMAARHMDSLARAVLAPPGRRALLRELSASFRLALVSNFDHAATARRVLSEAGIADCFDAIVISDEEGVRKPCARIFRAACERLGASPGSCLHVGDALVEDVHGATGAGLSALWVRSDLATDFEAPREDAAPAMAVLRDVRVLPAWLRSAGLPRG